MDGPADWAVNVSKLSSSAAAAAAAAAATTTTNACSQAVDDLGLLHVAARLLYLVARSGPPVHTLLLLLGSPGVLWAAWVALRIAAQFRSMPFAGRLRVDQVFRILFRISYLLGTLPILFGLSE